ncbi:uncharacterized protein Nmag_3821 (plasmid) [Natrialba magadii ATCC 43099]|uniref:Uncharacterized protein n=1 Tax=Natrialba magadii (strain ATCC 43099 / DSM 3394 / CCM 3739 / CIP 104546 / IAM 13178 / JCM 8861 / NBRC 102185 / NCIMB 2190 / MS3) TaxID=547559 RepID=D3T1A3_NATMM|nr:uncharacterized protein Nmag_3821 [Natrialba magadii ATCC 43099]
MTVRIAGITSTEFDHRFWSLLSAHLGAAIPTLSVNTSVSHPSCDDLCAVGIDDRSGNQAHYAGYSSRHAVDRLAATGDLSA